MEKQFNRILNLSKKTGDRIIVFDKNDPDNSYVVMPLDQYEKIALSIPESELQNKNFASIDQDLTEDEIFANINENDAISEDIDIDEENVNFSDEDSEVNNNIDSYAEYLASSNLSQEQASDKKVAEQQKKDFQSIKEIAKKSWKIPEKVKDGADEIIEEDRQYLEEIPF